MSDQNDVEARLEHVDVDVRSPSIVLSVRLDQETARQLHSLARQRGVRMSDLLREAATAYAVSARREQLRPYLVEFMRQRVAVGTVSVDSQGSARPQTTEQGIGAASGWGAGASTRAAVAG